VSGKPLGASDAEGYRAERGGCLHASTARYLLCKQKLVAEQTAA
jgi:hypothetical protein